MLVLDLDGRILRRMYLPLPSIRPERGVLRYDLFTVDDQKLYELVRSDETDEWNLLVTDLDSGPGDDVRDQGSGFPIESMKETEP